MALDTCDPCSCTPGYVSTSVFYQQALIILCKILAALPGGAVPFVFQTSVAKAFGSITGVYVATGFFASASEFNYLRIENTTDSDVDVRIGASGGTFKILSNGSQEFNGNIFTAGELYLKYDSVAPTLGSVTFEGASR